MGDMGGDLLDGMGEMGAAREAIASEAKECIVGKVSGSSKASRQLEMNPH